jgi:hypothetical protein
VGGSSLFADICADYNFLSFKVVSDDEEKRFFNDLKNDRYIFYLIFNREIFFPLGASLDQVL